MNSVRYRAWRFTHPDFDASQGAPGLGVTTTGAVALVQEDAAVRQAILLLLSTRPGERLMRPEYGCALHRLAFMPNDDTTAGLAIHYVRQAIERWEPRVDILALDAKSSAEQPNHLEVWLEYRVRRTQRADQLRLNLPLLEREL